MALSDRAKEGLRYAAAVAGVGVDAYRESVLEVHGNYWADQKEAVLMKKRIEKLARAPKAVTDALDAGGDGQEFAGWTAGEGVRTKPCGRCDGTGLAP